jgi:hypothetical protein
MSRAKSDTHKAIRRRLAVAKYRANPANKAKLAAKQKEYRQRPEVKEKHRLDMAQWRKENHDKFIEISRKSYKKNAKRLNAAKQVKYRTDPEYVKKVRDREKRYKERGRRQEMHKKRYIAKADECRRKSREWKEQNPVKYKARQRQYRVKVQIYKEREQRKKLDDRYVIMVIKKSLDYKIKTQDIPHELIEIERLKILTFRNLKQNI